MICSSQKFWNQSITHQNYRAHVEKCQTFPLKIIHQQKCDATINAFENLPPLWMKVHFKKLASLQYNSSEN